MGWPDPAGGGVRSAAPKWRELHHDLSPGDAGEGGPRGPVLHRLLSRASRRALQTEDFAVFVRAPSGVEFSESDEALAARYQALSSQMEYLATHIKEIE